MPLELGYMIVGKPKIHDGDLENNVYNGFTSFVTSFVGYGFHGDITH